MEAISPKLVGSFVVVYVVIASGNNFFEIDFIEDVIDKKQNCKKKRRTLTAHSGQMKTN